MNIKEFGKKGGIDLLICIVIDFILLTIGHFANIEILSGSFLCLYHDSEGHHVINFVTIILAAIIGVTITEIYRRKKDNKNYI